VLVLVLPSFPTRRSSDLVVLLVAQGQRTIAAAVHAPDLNVGFAVAEVVLRGQQFADGVVAAFVMDRRYQQFFLVVVVKNAEQLRSEEHTSELQSRENLVC